MPPNQKSDSVTVVLPGGATFRVAVGPVLLTAGRCGVVQFADGSGQAQRRRSQSGHWLPGGCTLKELALATPCADPEGAR